MDLIDFSDILPTLAEAMQTRHPQPKRVEGRSFLPQLKGEKGSPRSWTYCWYDPCGGTLDNTKTNLYATSASSCIRTVDFLIS